MGWFVFWVAVGILCAVIAPSRGRSTLAWFLLGFLFGPFALIALLALPSLKAPPAPPLQEPPRSTPVDWAPTKTCPRCAETIKKAAVVCRFCGYEYPATTPAAVTAAPAATKRLARVYDWPTWPPPDKPAS